jgi:excisionase family DNA binding protein
LDDLNVAKPPIICYTWQNSVRSCARTFIAMKRNTMDADEADVATAAEGQEPMQAPSARAQALRDEIFGSALTLDEAAYILSLDRTTVAKYLRENTIVGFQIGREWLIPEEELRAYVRRMVDQRRAEARQTGDPAQEPTLPGPHGGKKPVYKRLFARDPRDKTGDGDSARFDKFTARARRVLRLAQEEAIRLNHQYMGTEHLLLGLLAEGEGLAAQVLLSLGVDLGQARESVEAIIGRGDRPVHGEVGLTPRAKKVLALAVDEVRRLDHPFIGTEHLLLGLLREREGIAGRTLVKLGVNLEQARAATLRVLAQRGQADAEGAVHEPVPPPPAAAATLLGPDEQALTCAECAARSPGYFRYCFHCGNRLPVP